ncbi:unnamed protein product [Lymnaea stagnalis]|uniref:HECT domain-containing protein n=1 Tax=Lymnaea stagnalis TaxID=6523 RepID=A0AAV2I8S1_LYMST
MPYILAWGKANSGALGLGGTEEHAQLAPQKVHSKDLESTEIRHISTGETHTLLCVKNGSVYSSGSNNFRQCGREANLSTFERVKGLQSHHVIQVATGTSHSVVLTQAHEVLTWGKNTEGQLGRGDASEEARGTPMLVKSLAVTHVLQVACGSDHTLVLTNEGRVGVWGSNSYGQLGLGSSKGLNLNRPTWVTSISGLPVAQVAAGGNHSFVLSKSGAIYGWGRNSFGQLGLNDTEDSCFPKQCRPLRSQRIKYICCGENHTACLSVNGRVFTFGAGTHGQLGHGSYNNEILPRQVMELTGSEVSQIACGRGHTLAYVPKTGRLYSFGLGQSGQLGLSTTDNKDIPTSVPGLFTPGKSQGSPIQGSNQGIRTIYAGGDHCFAIAQDNDICVSDDFRVQDQTRQILTLSKGRFEVLQALQKYDIPSDELVEEMTKIFSFASCLNGSFLLPNDDHYETTSKKHGVDMNEMRSFFTELKQLSNIAIMKMISASIEKNLIRSLPQSPPDVEALRVYLMLPECPLFDQPELYSSIIISFAKSFISFKSIILAKFDSWWSNMQPTFFNRLVMIYTSCLGYFLTLPHTNDPLEVRKRLDSISISLNMLQKLNEVNEAHNQIIPVQEFYVPDLKDKIANVYISWAQQTNYLGQVDGVATQGFYLCNYPFIFDGAAKSVLLQIDAAWQMQVSQHNALMESIFPFLLRRTDPAKQFLILTVQRKNLVQDTLAQLQTKSSADFKKPLKIIFQEEEASDAGGVRKEFFRLLFKEVMDPAYGMFKINESSKLLWFNPSTLKEPNMFKMIGMLCGLAVYNSTVIHLDFPQALFKKLLKRPVTLDDFKELDPVSGKGLQDILKYEDDKSFEDAYLFFETQGHPSVELCPGGGDKPVDQTNKHEYINLSVDFHLSKAIELQFKAFSEGFHSVCGGQILELFNPNELQTLVVGTEDYDFNEFQKNTEYKEDYNSDHPVIMMFWEVFHEISLEDKKQFLLFLTAADRIFGSGVEQLKMTIQPLEGEERLMPMAYTCYNLLRLPRYTSKEKLKERFLLAIKQTNTFGLR